MSPRPLLRIVVRLLMVVSLVGSGIVAPAQEIEESLQQAAEMADAAAAADMPCGGMDMPSSAVDTAPCDCCPAQGCDLSACLGTACLPDLPRIAASASPAAMSVPWQQPVVPAGFNDTPLRPPIA